MPFPVMQPLVRKALGRGLVAAGVLSPKGRVTEAFAWLPDHGRARSGRN